MKEVYAKEAGKYKQSNAIGRGKIESYYNEGKSISCIAKQLKRSKSTISEEIKRSKYTHFRITILIKFDTTKE